MTSPESRTVAIIGMACRYRRAFGESSFWEDADAACDELTLAREALSDAGYGEGMEPVRAAVSLCGTQVTANELARRLNFQGPNFAVSPGNTAVLLALEQAWH